MSEFRFPDPSEREKRARLIEMLDVGKVMVYVDPRRPGVDLPIHLRGQVAVPLNLSRRFGLDVFEIGPLSVKASLSFGGERHLCVLPYRAIFGYYGHSDGSRLVFADSVPPEVAVVEGERDEGRSSGAAAPKMKAAGPGDAREAVERSTDDTQASSDEAGSTDAKGRPTLRLIE